MQRVFGLPTPGIARHDNSSGIAQVVLNLAKHLPEFGYELVETAANADLIAHHAGAGDGKTQVAHCHGLYPTAMRGFRLEKWHWEANRRVIEDLRSAGRWVTVPSEWVADIIRRDMKFNPFVIQWAVDTQSWTPGENKGYVLWNKNRNEGVCDPAWVNKLAERFPRVSFVTTFGDTAPNVEVIGKVPHDVMKEIVAGAGVYLATTKETGDIGSREAMACGVPVLGFNQGATRDLVGHGVDGFLATVDDFDGLSRGLEYVLEYRDILGENALKKVSGYTWRDVARKFSIVYNLRWSEAWVKPKISVVIPCYNYAQYITAALDSVFASETTFDYEVIVVNDASTDDSQGVINSYPRQFERIHLTQNGGVARARNIGIARATGDYIVCLDADDRIAPEFLQICAERLQLSPTLGIVYTGLSIVNDEGVQTLNPWPTVFDGNLQLKKENRIPSCCMFRREVWERVGGFRGRYTPAEDAEFWTRAILLGFGAKKVSDQGLFWYRVHAGSLSRTHQEPEWIKEKGFIEEGNLPMATFAQPTGASWAVRNYDAPLVSVIIPVGAKHTELVARAVDSVERQSFWNWEVIVIKDTQMPLADLPPYVKIIDGGVRGAGAARNLGVREAQGQFIVFLDADDELHPQFLGRTLTAFKYTGAYIYTDMILVGSSGEQRRHDTEEFSPGRLFDRGAFHAITCLVPAHLARRVKFDESMDSYEDLQFYMGLIADQGLCGKRLAEPLLYYYTDDGERRLTGNGQYKQYKDYLAKQYGRFIELGEKPVCSCMDQQPAASGDTAIAETDIILASYAGPAGNHGVNGGITGTRYGRHAGGDVFYIDKRDLADPRFSVVTQVAMPAPTTPMPGVPAYA